MLSIVVDLLASANVLCDGSRTSIDLKSLNEIPLEYGCTRHNSADSVPTSNLVFRRSPLELLSLAGIIYYPCSLIIGILCTSYKNAFNKRF